MKAAKLGVCQKVGNDKKIHFWEDHWFGSSSLAIQFWDLYIINNEQNKTIDEVWDGTNLKLTFRRTVTETMFQKWLELCGVAESITCTDEADMMIQNLNSKEVYSAQALYAVISFRGVRPVYPPAIWDTKVPSRIHVFLWLLANNKLLTRDNLSKRR